MASKISNKGLKRSALSIALGMCFASSMVLAQSTSGGIFGSVPAGSTVTISNNSGISRTVTADANGRYAAGNLPVGNYTVTAGGVKRLARRGQGKRPPLGHECAEPLRQDRRSVR